MRVYEQTNHFKPARKFKYSKYNFSVDITILLKRYLFNFKSYFFNFLSSFYVI